MFEPARWLHGTTGHFTTDLLIHHGALVAAWLVPARASTYTIAVFRSTDGGLTWTGAPLDLPDYTFYGVDGMDWPFSLASDSRGHLFMAYASLEKGIALARLDEVGRVQATFDI
ncbi:MAG: hypothetical protein HYZ58_15205, partial [Acidobacteria bacterium]|nr:hypothetical protein [Acidobacteriota bacterium]